MVQVLSFSSRNRFYSSKYQSYRGRRAGRQVKERELCWQRQIEVIQPGSPNHGTYSSKAKASFHNQANCIVVPVNPNPKPAISSQSFVPPCLLSNVMSLAPKIDEVRVAIQNANFDFVCMTETWLKEHHDDNIVNIAGYNIIRRDRVDVQHGGVCIYVQDSINYKILDDLMVSKFEVLWMQI